MAEPWVQKLVGEFGLECRNRLGLGEPEAAISTPVENLVRSIAERFHFRLHLHREVRRPELGVRPDFAARLGDRQEIIGYLELKRPGRSVTRSGLRGRDLRQWETMTQLSNVLYTNGSSWVLYRDGEAVRTVHLEGDLERTGSRLRAPGEEGESFRLLIQEFLVWRPDPITSVRALIRAVAPLCRLLKEEVLEQLAFESESYDPITGRATIRQFTALAKDWERVLFPRSGGKGDYHVDFADRYAQAVTHALILARVEGLDVTHQSLHEVGQRLGAEHTVMGKSLQILTDPIGRQFGNCLDMLVRVIGAIEWGEIKKREPDAHVYLYEDFLEAYDKNLRRKSGTYFTPMPLVQNMVRLTEEILETRLGCSLGLADSKVTIVDPAMGSGSFLSAVIDRVANRWEHKDDGERIEALDSLSRRLVGFEKQMGAFAVAAMRITQALSQQQTRLRLKDMHLHLADTLSDPWAKDSVPDLGAVYAELIEDRRTADRIKHSEPVTVVIGNPPFMEQAFGLGGWIETGSPGHFQAASEGDWFDSEYAAPGRPLLDGFRLGGTHGTYENKLRNMYVYFWRWATYKVFEQHRSQRQNGAGLVCFVSMAGFLRGPGFRGMREYLRRTCSEGWIIDLSPEGHMPPGPTRLFPGVKQELAVAIFVRKPDTSQDEPAVIHYTALTGHRDEKYRKIDELTVESPCWQQTRTGLQAELTPAPHLSDWDEFPTLADILPWTATGITPHRTWVYGPDKETLRRRWNHLVQEQDLREKALLFKETRDRTLFSVVPPLPGNLPQPEYSLSAERGESVEPVPVCFRSFDRQWIIPDNRLLDMPRPDLWRARREDQIFLLEQHSHKIEAGPALAFSALIPDKHAFRGSGGGRTLPLRHADGVPNISPGLLQHLANSFLVADITADDLAAYIAGVAAHPAYTRQFADELNTPGVRIPITGDSSLWNEAVSLGKHVIWAATFGERYVDSDAGRPAAGVGLRKALPEPIVYRPVIDLRPLPSEALYDSNARQLQIGTGKFHNVNKRMWEYTVDGRRVIDRWLSSRGSNPTGRVGSFLDRIRSETWQKEWSEELIFLLASLRHLTDLEPAQANLLNRILARPLITKQELLRREILPVPSYATKPRPAVVAEDVLPGMGEFGGQLRSRVQPISPGPPDAEASQEASPNSGRRRGTGHRNHRSTDHG
ncbi:type ISP restriction/modification enzyme [Streptomyces sp. NPDC059373]